MKSVLYILFVMILFSYKSQAQSFKFQGNWSSSTSRTQFTLKLLQTNTLIRGTHTSVQLNGNRIDASLDHTDITIKGVVVKNSINEAIVTFRSGYSNKFGVAKLTRKNATTIKWQIIEKPSGEYHIPDIAILRKE